MESFSYNEFSEGLYSEAVTVTGPAKFIYLAGIGPKTPEGEVLHKDNFLEQCRLVWDKVEEVLKANGATLADIVKATSYLIDVRDRGDMQTCRAEAFEGQVFPPHTFLNVSQLARPGMMIEVDVVAAVAAE
ncbi:hypothetical protein BV911_18400 [Pseudoruegeria sp. SK021]|nr:hypothetical protein BV911_18400 [Pseudoruegeria sp. SK021]